MIRTILVLLLLASPLAAQSIPLTLKGDTAVVKVDRVIVAKEDRTVVKSFPVLIVAPVDIGFYRWSYPTAVKATDKGNVLQIDAAPKGDVTINLKVESAVIDGGKVKYVTQFADIMFSVGDVAPTPPEPVVPPTPIIPPTDPLVATLQAAYATDPDPNKVANTASLAGLYHVAAEVAYDGTVVKVGDLYTRMKVASASLKLTNAVVSVRKAISVELDRVLPTDPNVALTDPLRKTFSDNFKRVENALGACK